jgi:hypothetical protein
VTMPPGYLLFQTDPEPRIFPANVEKNQNYYLAGSQPTPRVFPANVGQSPAVTGVGQLYIGIPGPKGDKGDTGDPGVIVSPTAPVAPAIGQLWVDTS